MIPPPHFFIETWIVGIEMDSRFLFIGPKKRILLGVQSSSPRLRILEGRGRNRRSNRREEREEKERRRDRNREPTGHDIVDESRRNASSTWLDRLVMSLDISVFEEHESPRMTSTTHPSPLHQTSSPSPALRVPSGIGTGSAIRRGDRGVSRKFMGRLDPGNSRRLLKCRVPAWGDVIGPVTRFSIRFRSTSFLPPSDDETCLEPQPGILNFRFLSHDEITATSFHSFTSLNLTVRNFLNPKVDILASVTSSMHAEITRRQQNFEDLSFFPSYPEDKVANQSQKSGRVRAMAGRFLAR